MNKTDKIERLKAFAEKELHENILPFWKEKTMDSENGGFYGSLSNTSVPDSSASKGLILNARILWTFSSAYQLTQDTADKEMATRAFEYLCSNFYDKEFDGYYWTVHSTGTPDETKKQIYALAFTIYGMSEYYKITENTEALNRAKQLFYLIEEKSFDKTANGYFEAYNRDWSEIGDVRLSAKDMNEKKTMNTHLHIVEAYANLYTVWKDDQLKQQLVNLVNIFLEKILSAEDNHLNLFFDECWNLKSSEISYGHDIEAGWLIHESALIHGDKQLIKKVEERLDGITRAALEGMSELGGLYHEGDRDGEHHDIEFEWWPQAEALVGLLNTYQVTGKDEYLDQAVVIVKFIEDYFIDKESGEWYYRIDPDGNPITSYEKAGLWKCPYHNGRACIEIIKRISEIA